MMACSHPQPAPVSSPPSRPSSIRLAVIPAESDAFPRVARALSTSLTDARIEGIDQTQVSRVSLEVVQLSVECVDATTTCYGAIGRSMAANRLLFARIDGGAKRQLKVTVTLFDVDASVELRSAERMFASEDEAAAGVAALVGEVAR
jgi:hypothetical protein